jgi:hypothetical protein
VPQVPCYSLDDDRIADFEGRIDDPAFVIRKEMPGRLDASGGQESVDLVFRDKCTGHLKWRSRPGFEDEA